MSEARSDVVNGKIGSGKRVGQRRCAPLAVICARRWRSFSRRFVLVLVLVFVFVSVSRSLPPADGRWRRIASASCLSIVRVPVFHLHTSSTLNSPVEMHFVPPSTLSLLERLDSATPQSSIVFLLLGRPHCGGVPLYKLRMGFRRHAATLAHARLHAPESRVRKCQRVLNRAIASAETDARFHVYAWAGDVDSFHIVPSTLTFAREAATALPRGGLRKRVGKRKRALYVKGLPRSSMRRLHPSGIV